MSTKIILASCYAVNPFKGSEDGMGWNFIRQIARFNKVIAVTRENNKEAIEFYMQQNPDFIYNNITFIYFDLPYWMRFWKKGSRGAMLYYYMWQKGIVGYIKKKKLIFDIVHNVNFHNDWTPSFLWKLKKPMVWGPVGHHPLIPAVYLKPYSFKYIIKDRLTWLVKKLFWNYSTALQKTISNANHIWCMNTGVVAKLKLKGSSYSIFPSVASEDFSEGINRKKNNFHVISAGRFVPLKGFDLTVRSFIRFLESIPLSERANCKLTLVGSGPERTLYEKIIAESKIQANVEIIEWIERKELMKLYEKASVFMFPSHEGAGMVVAEALSFGLPVICFDNIGPGQYITSECGFVIPKANYTTSVFNLKQALSQLYLSDTLLSEMSAAARKRYLERFTWESRGEHLRTIYNTL
ncbi:glycosyltransferase family 4 protein [Flavobacterium pectinovorum]|uniref:glycosyltransferase family 4 protein n=1 Tax=Flavobacterium pectinovorum TaxID=29533 RepID=UPI0026602A3B|nr:glycosyltransferase family 4 protein [Flavobacterium pectinovorum]WKL47797.1 glycosyltransferase family 4 protein [Flavobacterium pectinovorum]